MNFNCHDLHQGKRTDIKPHEWDKFGYFAKVGFCDFLEIFVGESRIDSTYFSLKVYSLLGGGNQKKKIYEKNKQVMSSL